MNEMSYNNNREDYKYKSWIFTWNQITETHVIKSEFIEAILKDIADDYVFQLEKVTRYHYQGYFKLKQRSRKSTVLNLFRSRCSKLSDVYMNNLTIQHLFGTDKEAIAYVTKKESRVMRPIWSSSLQPYLKRDMSVLDDIRNWHPWQIELAKVLEASNNSLTTPDDRHIIWVCDTVGNSGKSKLVKYYCLKYSNEIIKVPFGNANQLRSAICAAGPKRVYFIDIPRTVDSSDELDSILSVIEDIKNGFVTTSMYGKYQSLMFDPPHIVVFANKTCPKDKLSKDRWIGYIIDNYNFKKQNSI